MHDTAHCGLASRPSVRPSDSTRIYDVVGRCPQLFSHKPVWMWKISARIKAWMRAAKQRRLARLLPETRE